MTTKLKKLIGNSFIEIADAIESGNFGKKVRIGLTTLGSEHGPDTLIEGALAAKAASDDIEIVLLGKGHEAFESYESDCESDAHEKMEELLKEKKIDACVTNHYNFPIGVSTVGRVTTPAKGKDMMITTTTGTSATNRTEAMFKNAIYGIIAAKAVGKENPTVGILNLDSARAVERGLKTLKENGYDINFSESKRSDGGNIMRGNDLILGSSDVMVMDTLTGNIMMKMFSTYTTGGTYEASGYGYGPGIGFDYEDTILILSRASGVPVIKNAILYAGDLVKNDLSKIIKEEYKKVKAAGYDKIIESFQEKRVTESQEEITVPEKEIVTESISGIDVLDLDVACEELWKNDIYAETGMGCTGPIISVNEKNLEKGKAILKEAGFIS